MAHTSHDAEPGLRACEPAGHGAQLTPPVSGCTEPGGHRVQVVAEPGFASYRPIYTAAHTASEITTNR